VVTLGLWGVVWLAKVIRHWCKPWRCRTCTRTRVRFRGRFWRQFEPILGTLFDDPLDVPTVGRREVAVNARHSRDQSSPTENDTVEVAEKDSHTVPH
jgi:hypothetical protein